MKKILISICVGINLLANAQESTIEAKGIGIARADATQDALRNAVSQAAGVVLSSNTTVENFMVISDAIATNTQGYIKSYSILKEQATAEGYEVTVKAVVTTLSIKADFALLAKGVGGVRFMAIYDPRTIPDNEEANFDLAIDQMNTYFASKKYRYIERTRFLQLQKEAMMLMEDRDTSGVSYAQQLAMLADAQFIILIKSIDKETKSENFDTKKTDKISIQTIVYDNCTSEGLGNQSLESNPIDATDNINAIKSGISSAVKNNMDDLIGTFSAYIGSWINNGIPYELRFYGVGGFRDLREMRTKLKSDVLFGGEMEIVGAQDFTKINCTYKKKPDELADKILDFSDQIPVLASKKIDVKLIFGRQISFAPQGLDIKKKKIKDVLPSTPDKKPIENKTAPATAETTTSTTSQPDENTPGIVVFSEAGEKFWLIVDGTKENDKPATKAWKNNITKQNVKIRIVFQDSKMLPLDQNIFITDALSGEKFHTSYAIKKKSNGKYVVRVVSAKPITNTKSTINLPAKEENNFNQDANLPLDKEVEFNENLTPSKKCTTPMATEDFNLINTQIKNEPFSETKLTICKQLLLVECLNTSQIRIICKHFSFENDKISFLKMAYSSCTEKQKYYLLNDLFSFSSSKQEMTKFLESMKK